MKIENGITKILLKGGVVSLLTRVVGLVVAFATQVFLSRLLGAELFGSYSLMITWCMILTVFAKQGMDLTILKFSSGYVSKGDDGLLAKLLGFVSIRVFLASLISIIILVSLHFFYPLSTGFKNLDSVFWGGLLICGAVIISVIQSLFRSRKKLFFAQCFEQIIRPANVFLLLLLGLLFRITFSPEVGVAFASLGVFFASLAGMALYIKKYEFNINLNFVDSEKKEWSSVSRPLLINSVFVQMLTYSPILIMGFLTADVEIAFFSVAIKLAAFISFGMVALNSISAPMIASNYRDGDYKKMREIARWSSRLAFCSGLVPAVILLIFGDKVLILYGKDFAVAYDAMVLLIFSGVVGAFFGPVGFFLSMTNQQTSYMKTTVLTLAITVILSFILVPDMGGYGAAMSVMIAKIMQNLICWILVFWKLGIDVSILGIKDFNRIDK